MTSNTYGLWEIYTRSGIFRGLFWGYTKKEAVLAMMQADHGVYGSRFSGTEADYDIRRVR